MFFLIFEFLTARGREAHFEKIRKSVKQNVNGSVEKHYVLLEFLTALKFCSMFRFREDTSRVSTKSGLGEVKTWPAGLDLAQKWPSCVRLSIRNDSLLKGGSKRGSEEGPRESPGKASTNRSKAKSDRRTPSERMMTENV